MPTLELTEQQILHVQSLLNQDKPSRTRLTREEKNRIILLLNYEIDAAAQGVMSYENDELTPIEIVINKEFEERIEVAERIIKKLK